MNKGDEWEKVVMESDSQGRITVSSSWMGAVMVVHLHLSSERGVVVTTVQF